MGKSFNQAILMGRLTADVEVRSTTTGKNVGSFTLAVDNQKGDGADFFDVTVWDKLADLMAQYTGKGSKVLVQGRLQQQTWDDKNSGQKRSKVVVIAYDVSFLDTKNSSSAAQDSVAEVLDGAPIDLNDIPF